MNAARREAGIVEFVGGLVNGRHERQVRGLWALGTDVSYEPGFGGSESGAEDGQRESGETVSRRAADDGKRNPFSSR